MLNKFHEMFSQRQRYVRIQVFACVTIRRKEDFSTHVCNGMQFKEASSQDGTKATKRMSFIKRKFRRVVISFGKE